MGGALVLCCRRPLAVPPFRHLVMHSLALPPAQKNLCAIVALLAAQGQVAQTHNISTLPPPPPPLLLSIRHDECN